MTSSDPVHEAVVAVGVALEDTGLVVGTAGNVSGRRADGLICLSPSATPYRAITSDTLAVVGLDGERVSGSPRPTTELAMHLACYRTFAGVGGVVHCHAPYASMFAVARRPIPAAVEEVTIYVGGAVGVGAYEPTGTDELAAEVVTHLADRSAVLLANHGLLCIGADPEDALHTALVVERTAQIVHGAALLGDVHPLPAAADERFTGMYRERRNAWTIAQ
ncbi:MAG: class II aldolase/adducin family protein [Acidimicrobiales bacterium]|nr:class II aldolase/adducin family protein [Acidimicrobiales bacterium]